ncbi:unnamed protein product, partial [marine sediment metagenome]
RYSPIGGVLDSAILHFPAGCETLVEIFVNNGTNQVLPAPATGGTQGNIGIALDAVTQSFDINLPIEQGTPLEVVVINHDEINSHTVSVILKVSDKKTYMGP